TEEQRKRQDTMLRIYASILHPGVSEWREMEDRVRRSDACEDYEFDYETSGAIARELLDYQLVTELIPFLRPQRKEAEQLIKKLSEAVHEVLELISNIEQRSRKPRYHPDGPVYDNNFYLENWLRGFSLSASDPERVGPLLWSLEAPLGELIAVCDRGLEKRLDELFHMPVFGQRGPFNLEERKRVLVQKLKQLIEPYTEDGARNKAFAEVIKELLALIDINIGKRRIENMLSGTP
ncbi:MAG: hypothetical protein ACWGNB_02235, partial [Thiogranum sp.]